MKVTSMETKAITIRVSPEAAAGYETAPVDQQRKLNALLSLRLSEATQTKCPVEVSNGRNSINM